MQSRFKSIVICLGYTAPGSACSGHSREQSVDLHVSSFGLGSTAAMMLCPSEFALGQTKYQDQSSNHPFHVISLKVVTQENCDSQLPRPPPFARLERATGKSGGIEDRQDVLWCLSGMAPSSLHSMPQFNGRRRKAGWRRRRRDAWACDRRDSICGPR
jgi:hypothetical protein